MIIPARGHSKYKGLSDMKCTILSVYGHHLMHSTFSPSSRVTMVLIVPTLFKGLSPGSLLRLILYKIKTDKDMLLNYKGTEETVPCKKGETGT